MRGTNWLGVVITGLGVNYEHATRAASTGEQTVTHRRVTAVVVELPGGSSFAYWVGVEHLDVLSRM